MSGRLGDLKGALLAVLAGAAVLGSCLGLAFFGSELAESTADNSGAGGVLLRSVVFFVCAGALAGVARFVPRPGLARSLLALLTALFVLRAMDELTRPIGVLYAFVDARSAPGFALTVARSAISGCTAGWTVARLARVYPYRHALGLGVPLAAMVAYGTVLFDFASSAFEVALYFVAYAAPFALGAWLAADFNPRGALFRTRAG